MTAYIRGMAELEAKLLKLIAAAPKIADEAVDVYTEEIAEDARSRVAVDTGALQGTIRVEGNTVVAGSEQVDYADDQEYGENGTPFMRPAADGADEHTPEAAAKAAVAVQAVV